MTDVRPTTEQSADETPQGDAGASSSGEQAPDNQDAASEAHEGSQGSEVSEDGGDGKAGREAARYRRRLREAEAERDALREQVERLQRREVERVAGEHLSVGSDVFTVGGVDLADVLDDGGEVDAAKVAEIAERIAAERPRLGVPRGFAHGQGKRSSAARRPASWQELMRPSA